MARAAEWLKIGHGQPVTAGRQRDDVIDQRRPFGAASSTDWLTGQHLAR
jgi:hypothetical protein